MRIKTNMSVAEYAELIETWEVHRCADGAENVYDLEDKDDYRLFIKSHGYWTARKLRKQNRFWFDGFNYAKPVPFPTAQADALELAQNLVDDECIAERPDLYKPFCE